METCHRLIIESATSIEQARKNLTQLKNCKAEIADIEKDTLNDIFENVPIPTTWSNKVASLSINILSKRHKGLFDNYMKQAKKRKLTADQIKTLLAQNRIHVDDPFKIGDAINNLQQYLYRLEHPTIKLIPDRKNKIKYTKQLLEELRALYPGILSQLDIALFGQSQNKAAMILFGQAYTYHAVIIQLLKELGQ